MHRLLILFTIIAAALAMFTPGAAFAADPSCSIHTTDITAWSIQDDHVDTIWDFQCGGALNWDYWLQESLQWQDSGGSWHTFDCANGNPCRVNRPSTGLYNGGSRHNGTNTWNTAGQLDCHTIRYHVTAFFPGSNGSGSDFDNFNSTTRQIGGC